MSFLLNWLWSYLSSFGIGVKKGKIVLLGLDNSGKTTLLDMLRNNKLAQHMPTQKPTMEEFSIGHLTFQTYDLGGHAAARRLWREYLTELSGVVFLVDASDPERFEESAVELNKLRTDSDFGIGSTVPLMILANKVDLPTAVSEDELRRAFGLYQSYGKDVSSGRVEGVEMIELFSCSIKNRMGYKEGFEWLTALMR